MSVISKTFTAAWQASDPLYVKAGDRLSFRVGIGGGAIRIRVQYSENGHAWRYLPVNYDDVFGDLQSDQSKRFLDCPYDGWYRLISTEYAAGSFATELRDEPRVIEEIQSQQTGRVVWRVTEEGIETVDAGRIHGYVSALAKVADSYATRSDEGLVIKKFDETIDLTGAGAAFVNLTDSLPAGAVILGIQCVVAAQITSDGTRVKVGIGPSSDPDKYCLTADDDLATAANSAGYPNGVTPLGGAEQLRVNGCTAAGAQAAENFTDGSVRVVGIYWDLLDLQPEAIIAFP